jgi:hypothetical protein
MEPGKTAGNITEQPDSEDTMDENKIKSTFSEDATSETQDPSPCARAPNREGNRLSITKKRWYDWRKENWSGSLSKRKKRKTRI